MGDAGISDGKGIEDSLGGGEGKERESIFEVNGCSVLLFRPLN